MPRRVKCAFLTSTAAEEAEARTLDAREAASWFEQPTAGVNATTAIATVMAAMRRLRPDGLLLRKRSRMYASSRRLRGSLRIQNAAQANLDLPVGWKLYTLQRTTTYAGSGP